MCVGFVVHSCRVCFFVVFRWISRLSASTSTYFRSTFLPLHFYFIVTSASSCFFLLPLPFPSTLRPLFLSPSSNLYLTSFVLSFLLFFFLSFVRPSLLVSLPRLHTHTRTPNNSQSLVTRSSPSSKVFLLPHSLSSPPPQTPTAPASTSNYLLLTQFCPPCPRAGVLLQARVIPSSPTL